VSLATIFACGKNGLLLSLRAPPFAFLLLFTGPCGAALRSVANVKGFALSNPTKAPVRCLGTTLLFFRLRPFGLAWFLGMDDSERAELVPPRSSNLIIKTVFVRIMIIE